MNGSDFDWRKPTGKSHGGKTENLWTIMDRMSKPGRLVKPGTNASEKKLLKAKYEVFLEQCRTQQEYRKKVDEATSSWGKESSNGELSK